MSWIKGSATGHIAMSNAIVAACTGTSLQSVDSVAAGGSGYVVGDLITLAGGTSTIAAVLEVTTVSAGAVTGARIENAGVYSSAPSDPVGQASTDGSGTGATFNLTFATNGWVADLDAVYSGSERNVIMHGSGSGSEAIYVGWRTYSDAGAGRYNWELKGFTGYNSGIGFTSQPGVSPGDVVDGGSSSEQYGPQLTMSSVAMNYYLSVTPSRIILVVQTASGYFPCYLGFINRFATSTEYPYPLAVMGSTNWFDAFHNQTELMSGLTDPWNHSAQSLTGSAAIRDPGGSWITFANSSINGGTRSKSTTEYYTNPTGSGTAPITSSTPQQDRYLASSSTDDLFSLVIEKNDLTSPNGNLEPSPGGVRVMFPVTYVQNEVNGNQRIFGSLDDVFWMSGNGGVSALDRIIQDGQVYRAFTNSNRSDDQSFFSVKEN